MTTIHDLIVELGLEGEMTPITDEYRSDLLWRISDLYDALPPDHEHRKWCHLTVMVLTGLVTVDEVRTILGVQ